MPTIINAYNGNQSIADSLRSLGDSMFGNQSQRELIRQKALEAQRENSSVQPLAAAAARGDSNALTYYGVMAGKAGADTANYNLLSRSNHAANVDDPTLATAQLGAHEPIASTAVGQGRDLANRTGIANIQAASQAATQTAIAERNIQQQQWQDEHTLVSLQGPDGRVWTVPKSQVSNLQAQGYRVPQTLDQVKANLITGGASSVAPAESNAQPASAAPPSGTPSLSTLTPDQRSIVGLPTQIQSYQHPQTGETATSQDGGLTLVRANGARVPAQGSGFMPVSNESALNQQQQNNLRTSVANPSAFPDPANSQAAADAQKASGLDAFAQEHANKTFGAIPGVGPVIKYFMGGDKAGATGEIGPDYERARSRQDIRNNEARTALLAAPGRQSIQAQRWVNELLPEDAAITNPATEAQKIPTIVNALQADADNERKIIGDFNTPAAERTSAVLRLHKIEHAVQMFTAPAENAQSAPAAKNAPQQQQQPPVSGAKQAPDGNWYVPDPGRPGKYLQVVQ